MALSWGKKGIWDELKKLILAMLVILVIIAIFIIPYLPQLENIFKVQIKYSTSDSDSDGVTDNFDQCPCAFGERENDGCPSGFTDEQKKQDKDKFNIDTGCGIISVEEEETGEGTLGEKTSEAKKPEETFQHYRSLEIFGNDDGAADVQEGIILQACPGWVGTDCPSQDGDCDGNFNNQPAEDGCWVMASEDDWGFNGFNDCGQYKMDSGAIISLSTASSFEAFLVENSFFSKKDEQDAKNLFQWKWKSTERYGSLLCKNGFWYGCRQSNEGLNLEINDNNYKCQNSEWVVS